MYIHSPSMSLSVFIVYIHTLAYLELQGYLKSCEMLTRHIQNPAMWHYSTIFRHIQNLVQCLHMQKPGILRISEYSKLFHNLHPNTWSESFHIYKNLQISKTLTYFKPDTYLEPSQRFKSFFAKIVKNYVFIEYFILDHWSGSEYTYLSTSTH